jgi:hypothetical protein
MGPGTGSSKCFFAEVQTPFIRSIWHDFRHGLDGYLSVRSSVNAASADFRREPMSGWLPVQNDHQKPPSMQKSSLA